MTILELQALITAGKFHHATYRNIGTLWEGLWIYATDPNGIRGFNVVGCFPKGQEDEAYALLRGTGISLGSYGNG